MRRLIRREAGRGNRQRTSRPLPEGDYQSPYRSGVTPPNSARYKKHFTPTPTTYRKNRSGAGNREKYRQKQKRPFADLYYTHDTHDTNNTEATGYTDTTDNTDDT